MLMTLTGGCFVEYSFLLILNTGMYLNLVTSGSQESGHIYNGVAVLDMGSLNKENYDCLSFC